MKTINGTEIAESILHSLKEKITSLDLHPKLAIVLASDDESSKIYTSMKSKKAESIGIQTELHTLDLKDNNLKETLISKLKQLNDDKEVHGILLQLPLAESIKEYSDEIINTIDPSKDVDGLTAINQGRLMQGLKTFRPATVDAILECIKFTCPNRDEEIEGYLSYLDTFLRGKNVVIINNSNLIGKPLSVLLESYNTSVSVLNKYSLDLKSFTQQADILITATGATSIIDHLDVKDNCTIIDVTSVKKEGQILGDVTISKELEEKVEWITPVPGGVGPLTIACLLRNLVRAIT
ncbi:MAG: bifunctional 5,10-methylenetetrahydrofolate dehydrogenase/5,10-methenyltetrahydrofolate cyclohydrolase [Candidatus Dojkabacteria bacterium]